MFFGPIGKTRWLPRSLDDIFSTSLKPLKGIQQNLIGVMISTSSTKFVFFGPIRKIRWPSSIKVTHCTQVHDIWPFWAVFLNQFQNLISFMNKNSEECMCCLRKIAMRDYQESVTTGQTDRRADGQSDTYVPLCFAGDTTNVFVKNECLQPEATVQNWLFLV